jgi:YfiH family protein
MPFDPGHWLLPDWPAHASVRALCSTRLGGSSVAPYESLNLGDHVGDDPAQVVSNRAIFQNRIGAQPVFLSQVHGTDVLQLNAHTPHGSVADAAVTSQLNLACTIMVADCLPVLLASRCGQWVAAAHAGWRGLAGQGGVGILEATFRRFSALAQSGHGIKASETIAWLGPCIGPQAFEVGDEVHAALAGPNDQAQQMFKRCGNKWLADLAGLARLRLRRLGVTQVFGNDSSPTWCTYTQPSRFFSHRRDRISGRMAVAVWRSGV